MAECHQYEPDLQISLDLTIAFNLQRIVYKLILCNFPKNSSYTIFHWLGMHTDEILIASLLPMALTMVRKIYLNFTEQKISSLFLYFAFFKKHMLYRVACFCFMSFSILLLSEFVSYLISLHFFIPLSFQTVIINLNVIFL